MRWRSGLAAAVLTCAAGGGARAATSSCSRAGRSIPLKQPVVRRGNTAYITRADGTLLSVPASEIDRDATAAANRRRGRPPLRTRLPASTPAEAARRRRRTGRRPASASPTPTSRTRSSTTRSPGPRRQGRGKERPGARRADGRSRRLHPEKNGDALVLKGTLRNLGQGAAENVRMTVTAIDEKGQPIDGADANLSKGTVEPGLDGRIHGVAERGRRRPSRPLRFEPAWTAPPPPAPTPRPGAAGSGRAAPRAKPPAPAPTPYGRGTLYAAPVANAPSEAPADGKTGYIPGADAARTTSPSRRAGRAVRRRRARWPGDSRRSVEAVTLVFSSMARILIVEDKDSLRAMLEEMLKAEGLQRRGRRQRRPGGRAAARRRAGRPRPDRLAAAGRRRPGGPRRRDRARPDAAGDRHDRLRLDRDGRRGHEARRRGLHHQARRPGPAAPAASPARSSGGRGRGESLLFAEAQSRAMPPIVGESAAIRSRARRDRARRRDRRHRPARGRERDRQGALRPRDPRALGPARRRLRRDQLRRDPGDAARERALRPRARAPSPAPPARRMGKFELGRRRARSFSTRSASSRRRRRASCCASCRSGRSTASAARSRSRSTCGSSPRPTARSRSSWRRASSARTSSTACGSSRSASRPCASGPRTSIR